MRFFRVAATDSPIIFLGTGEHFDEFETFNAESFVSRLLGRVYFFFFVACSSYVIFFVRIYNTLGLGDMKGLLSTVAEAVPLDKQPQMLNRLAQGLFSLRDMRDQFQVRKFCFLPYGCDFSCFLTRINI